MTYPRHTESILTDNMYGIHVKQDNGTLKVSHYMDEERLLEILEQSRSDDSDHYKTKEVKGTIETMSDTPHEGECLGGGYYTKDSVQLPEVE